MRVSQIVYHVLNPPPPPTPPPPKKNTPKNPTTIFILFFSTHKSLVKLNTFFTNWCQHFCLHTLCIFFRVIYFGNIGGGCLGLVFMFSCSTDPVNKKNIKTRKNHKWMCCSLYFNIYLNISWINCACFSHNISQFLNFLPYPSHEAKHNYKHNLALLIRHTAFILFDDSRGEVSTIILWWWSCENRAI